MASKFASGIILKIKISNFPMFLNFIIFLFLSSIPTILAFSNQIFIDDIAEFPYLARIITFYGASCSASIISQRHLMAAAHCMRALNQKAFDQNVTKTGIWYKLADTFPQWIFYVQFGVNNFDSPGLIEANVSRIAVPPSFPKPFMPFFNENPLKSIKDMLILELKNPLKLTKNVQPVKILSEKGYKQIRDLDKEKCIMAGMGGNTPQNMSYGIFKLANDEVCSVSAMEFYWYWQNFRNFYGHPYTDGQLGEIYTNTSIAMKLGQICGSPNPSNMEGGNSGGPALVRNHKTGRIFQIGIVQNRLYTNQYLRVQPFYFTRIGPDCKWLAELTEGEVKCEENFDADEDNENESSSDESKENEHKNGGDSLQEINSEE